MAAPPGQLTKDRTMGIRAFKSGLDLLNQKCTEKEAQKKTNYKYCCLHVV